MLGLAMSVRDAGPLLPAWLFGLAGTVGAGGVAEALELVCAERVLERSGVVEATGRDTEAKVLGQQAGGGGDRPRGNVLVRRQGRPIRSQDVAATLANATRRGAPANSESRLTSARWVSNLPTTLTATRLSRCGSRVTSQCSSHALSAGLVDSNWWSLHHVFFALHTRLTRQ